MRLCSDYEDSYRTVPLQVTTPHSNRCRFWCLAIRHVPCSLSCGVTGLLSSWCGRQWKTAGTRMRRQDSLHFASRNGSRNYQHCGTAREVLYNMWCCKALSSVPNVYGSSPKQILFCFRVLSIICIDVSCDITMLNLKFLLELQLRNLYVLRTVTFLFFGGTFPTNLMSRIQYS